MMRCRGKFPALKVFFLLLLAALSVSRALSQNRESGTCCAITDSTQANNNKLPTTTALVPPRPSDFRVPSLASKIARLRRAGRPALQRLVWPASAPLSLERAALRPCASAPLSRGLLGLWLVVCVILHLRHECDITLIGNFYLIHKSNSPC